MTHANLDWPSLSDPLVPTQFTELLQRSTQRTGEQRLLAAVLEEAMRSFCRWAETPGRRARRLFDEAAEWFASPDVSGPFAFENVCHALELDPEWIRRLLRRRLVSERLARGGRHDGPSMGRITSGRLISAGRRAATRVAC